MNPEIAIVVAIDEKKGIGKEGGIPWPRIPEDRKRFVDLTTDHPIIMGRKTLDSLPNRQPLKRRQNIVISRQLGLNIPGCQIAHSLGEAIETALELELQRISIIGGGEIYQEALPLADILYLTRIKGDFNCDTFFPEFEGQFPYARSVYRNSHNGISYTFEDLTKIP